ncbi:MAG TPA: prepilin peptidase [Sphingomonadaceae bacterium]|nr:prepilin peptidase [Sphingomonadaceae bacterium]
MSPSILLLGAALAGLLLWAAWGDIQARIIPNRLNAAIALLAPAWWWAQGFSLWPQVALAIAGATIIFALFAAAFAFGMMGGGDVKLLTALAFWCAGPALLQLLMVMALAGGVVTLATLALHRAGGRPGRPEIPYGVAISAAGLWVITNDILTTAGA